MSGDPVESLAAGLKRLKLRNVAAVSAKLLEFGKMVLAQNRLTNLTGAKDLAGLISGHILDSLAPLGLIGLDSPVIDLGSGAGLPGIPAAIAYPDQEFVLLEPRAKRAAFLEEATRGLDLKNCRVLKTSALGPGAAQLAGKAGTVLMRAVAAPEKSMILGLGLLRPGGKLLLYEGRSGASTLDQRRAASRAGGGEIRIQRVFVPGLSAVRHAWIVEKAGAPKGR